ncbi:uncharacterized protein LOC131684191 [Topomyia yanbarensis]|uniref:uncharacterized protein LOC131684191 n=1 Tax=Topomyia yanbarensis TaxID=2498891 RepID=UPI00273B9FE3|nr:uncharacterized protein LOC131684191 [Topomyia yanbarensis]
MNRKMNLLLSTLLMFCAIHVQTFAARIKQKRLLYDLADPFVSVTESTSFHHPTTFQPSVIYSSDSPILDQIIKPIPSGFPSYHSKPSLHNIYKNNYFEYSNYGSPFQFIGGNHLGFNDEETYIADGRILKQYSVLEHHADDIERHRLLQPDTYNPSPSYFSNELPDVYNRPLNLAYSTTIGFNPRLGLPLNNHSPLLTKNHGPVALGSGSLGYIHGPNGVALGSGSLGYISHQQHRESLSEISARKNQKHRPGPLHFGHNHD